MEIPATDGNDAPISKEECEAALRSVTGSDTFQGSARLQEFLTYVVECSLSGDGSRIRAKTIAEDVYGRSLGTTDDNENVVRVDAGRLRRRLDMYYLKKGQFDPVIIKIDPGGYEPRFERQTTISATRSTDRPRNFRSLVFGALGATAAVAVAGVALLIWTYNPVSEPQPNALSIVVLPFNDMGGNKSQDYLADAITDQLTIQLARIPDMLVIARNSAFTYKGKSVDLRQIGMDLGVRSALKGSIQITDDRIRINAQLIDTVTGTHIWAETFDKRLAERFKLQDEIVVRLARSLHLKISEVVARQLQNPQYQNLHSDVLALKCETSVHLRGWWSGAMHEMLQNCRKALVIDPNNVHALSALGQMYALRVVSGASADRPGDINRARNFARQALAADGSYWRAHLASALALTAEGQHEEAIDQLERTLDFNPSSVVAHYILSAMHLYVGEPEKTIEIAERGKRLSPRDPQLYAFYSFLGRGNFMLGRNEPAIAFLRQAVTLNPEHAQSKLHLAAVLGSSGQEVAARAMLKEYFKHDSGKSRTIAQYKHELRTTNPKYVANFERLIEGLRRAGMAEN